MLYSQTYNSVGGIAAGGGVTQNITCTHTRDISYNSESNTYTYFVPHCIFDLCACLVSGRLPYKSCVLETPRESRTVDTDE